MSHPIPTQDYPCENCGGDVDECGCGENRMKNPFTHLYPIAAKLANQEQKRIMSKDPYKKLFEEFDREITIADFIWNSDKLARQSRRKVRAFIRKHTYPKSEAVPKSEIEKVVTEMDKIIDMANQRGRESFRRTKKLDTKISGLRQGIRRVYGLVQDLLEN